MENEKKRKSQRIISTNVVGMSLNQSVQRHGEAASQMLQAYKGIRVDSLGNNLHHKGRNLKQISSYKTGNNPALKNKIIKSQAGFSGELIKEARDNKNAILKGDSFRVRTTDGIGQTNNPIFDHIKVDQHGNYIDGSGSQMKIYKTGISKKYGNTYDVIDKLAKNKEWEKYDCPIDIPSDQYEGAVEYARKKEEELRKQADACKRSGKTDLASKYEDDAAKYENAGENVRKADLTTEEAITARINPKAFVSKELLHDMHNAGKEAAIGTAIMSGVFSSMQNTYLVITAEKDISSAAKDILTSTAISSAQAYGIDAAGVSIKATMHSSNQELVRRLGRTNIATTMITATLTIGEILKTYASGEIDEVEVLESLGLQGTSLVAAGFGGAVGAIGGPIGSIVGATFASLLTNAIYDNSLQILKENKISIERRAVMEAMCQEAIESLCTLKAEVEYYITKQNEYRQEHYDMLFDNIQSTLFSGNVDGFIQSINSFADEFHIELQFKTFEEFDQFMSDDLTTFIL